MPRTVEEGFRDFHTKLTPSGTESDAAKRHRASIEAVLKREFEMTRFFRTGSFGNGTSISGYSDVDYFASIPRKNLSSNSGATLRKVRDVLAARFPNTGVGVRTPGVLVPFGNRVSEWTEVVPADFISRDSDRGHTYEIADGSAGWMRSSPDSHNAYVAYRNKKLGYKVKPLVRFLKAWKYLRNVPIQSFYLELRVAKYSEGESSIVYSIDVTRVLRLLVDNGLAAIRDPMGVSGLVHPCGTQAEKNDAMSKLRTAATRAEKACEAENEEKTKEAFDWWDLVYDDRFPSYYR